MATQDYSSSAIAVVDLAQPVSVIGTPTVTLGGTSGTPSVGLTASATTGTPPTLQLKTGVTNAGVSIKASAGRLFGISVSNFGATAGFFNVYAATAITIGVTVPVYQILVPAGATVVQSMTLGTTVATGIMIAATDNSAVLSAIAPATPFVANVLFL